MTTRKMRMKMKIPKPRNMDIKNAFEDNRRITYMCWCGLLAVILTIWVGSCGYVIYYGNEAQSIDGDEAEEEEEDFLEFLRKKHNEKKPLSSSTYMNMFFYISLIIILINMIPVKVYRRLGTNFLMVLLGLVTVFLIVHIGLYFTVDSTKYKKIMFWLVPEAITILVCVLSTYVAALCNNTSATSGLLKRISRFYLFYRHLITFGLFLLMSILYLETFTLTMLEGLGPSNILFYTILGGSCYIILFIFYFGAFVISATTATYYCTQNNEQCPIKAFFHATVSVIRYHLGAVCFNATAVLPPLVAAFAILKSEFDTVRGFSFVLSTISLAEDSAKMETAKIVYDKRKSLFRVCRITQPLSHLKGVPLIWIILAVVLLSTNIIMVFLRWERSEDDPIFSWAMITSYSNVIGLWLPFILLIDMIMDSIIIYVTEKDRESEVLGETPYQTLLDTTA